MERVAPAEARVVTGETPQEPVSAEPSAPPVADKPFLVYVIDPAAAQEDVDKVEKVVLKDDRIGLAAKAFTCVKMDVENAKADPIVSKQGKASPRLVVISADYKNALGFEKARLSAGSLYDGMKAAADKVLAKPLDTAVKEMRDLLVEMDKIYAERKTLTEKKQRLEEKGDKAAGKEIKEIEAKLAALDERQKKADEKQAAALTLKSAKPA